MIVTKARDLDQNEVLTMGNNLIQDRLSYVLHSMPLRVHLPQVDHDFLERFEQIVREHGCELEFTTSVAAKRLGISRMHLNRRLRALTGKSTHELILDRQMELARTLLTQPLPVAYVALSVGFRSFSHFAKVFRKRFGVTPSAFRARQS